MKFDRIIEKIQDITGAAKLELTAVFIVLFGAIMIYPSMNLYKNNSEKSIDNQDLYLVIDSLSEFSRSSYIGSNVKGDADSLLTAGDTLIEKESFFPKTSSKKIINGKVSLNSASKTELMNLPGVGEATAMKIIEYRLNKRFINIADIKKVKGIGEKKYEKMKEYLKL